MRPPRQDPPSRWRRSPGVAHHTRPIPGPRPRSIVGPGGHRRWGASCSRGSGRRMTRGATGGTASGRCSTGRRVSPVITSGEPAAPGGSTGISRSRPRRNSPPEVRASLTRSAWTTARGGFDYRMGNAPGGSSRPGMWFSMDYGTGRMDYRMGNSPANSSRPRSQLDPRLLAAIHPGFRESRSVVLHQFGTDPAYNAWRGSVPGQHGSILVRTSERNPPASVRRGPDRCDPRRGDRGGGEAKVPGLVGGQGASEPPQGRADRPLRVEGADGDAQGVRPLRRRRRDGPRGPRPSPGGRPPPPRDRRDGAGHGRSGMRRPDRLRAKPSHADRHPSRPTTGSRRSSSPARRPSSRSAAPSVICRSWEESTGSTATCSCTT